MSVQTDFEKEFETEEYEMLILVQASCGGAVCIKDMLKPSVDFLASIDLRTGQLFHEKGCIEWLIKENNKRKGWGYEFEQYGIYRVAVRKCIPQKLQPYQLQYMNNRYMLIGVLEENASNEKLEALKEHYSKPVSMKNELGSFILDREFSWFEGSINWNGVDANVYLETDEEDGDTAEQAMTETQELFERDEQGHWLIGRLGIDGEYVGKYEDMLDDPRCATWKDYNIIVEKIFNANVKVGYWEIFITHTKPLDNIGTELL